MTYQAVLFDLDGTLLNTIDDLADAMNLSLAAMQLPAVTVAQCKIFVGDGMRSFALRSLPQARRDDATVAQLTSLYRDAYAANWACKTGAYDGIEPLLDRLAERKLKMVVYSNKPDEFTQIMVKKFLSRWHFDAVVGARSQWPNKPDPKAALDIARQLGLQGADFVYVGDTNTDMQTAVAAGMYPVGALWGFRTAEELLTNGARKLIKHPLELLDII